MNVGELKAFLAESGLPDDAPVYISGRYCLHECEAEEAPTHPPNSLGQAQFDGTGSAPNALLFQDRSRG